MAWNDFINSLKGKEKKKKDADELLSVPFLCKFSPKQMRFIEEQTEIYGSKANVIRQGLNKLMKQNTELQQQ